MNTQHLEQISFHGDLLWAGRDNGDVLVAIKPICMNLTIDWMSQMKRINRDAILSKGKVIMTLPSPGGPQETICLTLPLVAGWLFGIDDRRIRDETVRAKVLDYKRECHDVLYRHFIGPRYSHDTNTLDPDEDIPLAPGSNRYLVEIAMVRESRRLHGVAAACALWQKLGLPAVPEMFPAPDASAGMDSDGQAVAAFMAECCADVPGHRTRLIDLWRCYIAWCEQRGRVPVVLQTLGRHFHNRGYHRVKISVTHYVGVALKRDAADLSSEAQRA